MTNDRASDDKKANANNTNDFKPNANASSNSKTSK
jgi:hypothetical protein